MTNDVLTPERARELLAAPDTTSQALQEVPATPTQTALAAFSKEDRKKLVCANLLTPEEQAAAQAEAKELAPELVSNIDTLFAYGTGSVDALNALVKQALAKDKTEVPEIDALMRQMQDDLRGVQKKYDVSVPEIRAKFTKGQNRVMGFLWKGKTMLQMLVEDSQSVVHQVEGVGERVKDKADASMKDARLFKQLYVENEAGIRNLVKAIAVLEYARAIILAEFESIKVDENDPSQHELVTRRGVLGRVLGSLNIRIGDFQSSLMDAFASSPEFSDWVQANFDLALKLDFLWRMGIPVIEKCLLKWQKDASAVGKAKTINTINDFYNQIEQQSAQAGATGIKEVEDAVQQSVMQAETMAVILKAAQDRAQGILDATKVGTEARQKFAEGALTTIQSLQATQVQLQQGLADQASSEAAALRASLEAQQAVGMLNTSNNN